MPARKKSVISKASPHTIKKFELIEEYIKSWAQKLMLNNSCNGLIFIDCMCNSGIYTDDAGEIVKGTAVRVSEALLEVARTYTDKTVYIYLNDKDAKRVDGTYHVFLNGGRVDTGLDALEWIRQGVDRGAGEVVVNSIDTDGVKKGFDLEMLRDVSEIVRVPVIASGGAGGVQDFVDLFREIPGMSAGLAASIFHFGEVAIPDLKQVLRENGVCVRL